MNAAVQTSSRVAEVREAGSIASAKVRRTRAGIEDAAAAARDAAQFRATDVVERARSALQRRGWMVCRATVVDGPEGMWSVSGQPGFIDDAALIAFAEKRGGNFTREYVPTAPWVPAVTAAPAVSTPAAADAATAPATGHSRGSQMNIDAKDEIDAALLSGADRLARANVTAEKVRDLICGVRDTFGVMDGGKGFTGWPEFVAAAGLGKSTLYNAANGYAKIGHAVIDAFFDADADGKLTVKAKWVARLAGVTETVTPPLNGTPVPLERAAAEAARFDKNIEDDGFVTVLPASSPLAGSAVTEGAGSDAPATVSAEKGSGEILPAVDGPADSAGGAAPVAPPAQPAPADWLARVAAAVRPPEALPAHTNTEPLFANPSPHAQQAGPNVHLHWRWKMRASMNMQLTSLLAKQAAAQDALDELNEAIKALRVLRAIGDELPEPDEDFVAAMVRGSTEVQQVAA